MVITRIAMTKADGLVGSPIAALSTIAALFSERAAMGAEGIYGGSPSGNDHGKSG